MLIKNPFFNNNFCSFLGSYSTSTTVGSHYGSPLGSIPSSHSFQPPTRHIDNIPPPLSALGPPHHPHHLPPGIENYTKLKRLPLSKIASLVDFKSKNTKCSYLKPYPVIKYLPLNFFFRFITCSFTYNFLRVCRSPRPSRATPPRLSSRAPPPTSRAGAASSFWRSSAATARTSRVCTASS